MPQIPPLRVAVLVELERSPDAGGHVKCWEQFARAATEVPEIDLTVYVLGRRAAVAQLAPNVRFETLPPVLSTGPVQRWVGGVDRSDLAPYHRALADRLPGHHVWHLTHALAFTGTALRLAARRPHPLVASVHTDVPTLTSIYTEQVVDRLPRPLGRALRGTGLPALPAALARRRRRRMLGACDRVLVSSGIDEDAIAAELPDARLSRLRRGVDRALFRPRPEAAGLLQRRHGVPADVPVVLFAGRVDATKGALLLAQAVHQVAARGVPVHLLLAGDGAQTKAITELLGAGVSTLGRLSQAELAAVYSACDVFAFPSRSETIGNVVAEAMASGLPVVLPRGAQTEQWLRRPGVDGLLVERDDPPAWADALTSLLTRPDQRRAVGANALSTSLAAHPSWLEVVQQDLVPVWQEVAGRRPSGVARQPDARAASLSRP